MSFNFKTSFFKPHFNTLTVTKQFRPIRCRPTFNNIHCDIEWKLNTAHLNYTMRAVQLSANIPRRYDHIINPQPIKTAVLENGKVLFPNIE